MPYDWVVSLDLDAAFNAPKIGIEEWLKQGLSKRSSGGGGRGRAATRAVPLSQIVDDDCATSHHGGSDLASGCVVVGKDLHGVAGVNGGVSFVRRSQQALELLAAWWTWPDRGADGVFDARLKFKVDFPMEQAALNGNAQVCVHQLHHTRYPPPLECVINGLAGGRCAPREERVVCARRADERALRPWAPYHPLHWTVSARAPLPASRPQLPQLWANPQVSLLALALWGQRGGTALCSPGLERDSVPPAAGGGCTPTTGTAIRDKHKLFTLGHIHVACGWLRLHSEDPLENSE